MKLKFSLNYTEVNPQMAFKFNISTPLCYVNYVIPVTFAQLTHFPRNSWSLRTAEKLRMAGWQTGRDRPGPGTNLSEQPITWHRHWSLVTVHLGTRSCPGWPDTMYTCTWSYIIISVTSLYSINSSSRITKYHRNINGVVYIWGRENKYYMITSTGYWPL